MEFSTRQTMIRTLVACSLLISFYSASAQTAPKGSKAGSSFLEEISDAIDSADKKAPAKDLNLSIPSSTSFQDVVEGKKPAAPAKSSEKVNKAPAEVVKTVASPFENQLAILIDGLKNNFTSLMGVPIAGKQAFKSKADIEGAVSTQVNYNSMMEMSYTADFGDFKTEEEAMPAYKKVAALINDAKNMPVFLTNQGEKASETGRTTRWTLAGNVDERIKNGVISLEIVKASYYDTDKIPGVYFVQLKIRK